MAAVRFYYHKKKAKIETTDIVLFEKVRQKFSVVNKAAKYIPHASDTWSPISPLGNFGFGIFFYIVKEFKKLDPNIQITIEPELQRHINQLGFNIPIEYHFDEEITERDYQVESIDLALKHGRGLFEIPTGAGKSNIIYQICMNMLKMSNKVENILILVPSLHLTSQMYDDFIDYGCSSNLVQKFASYDRDIKKQPIIISNRDWLDEHSNELPRIDAVIIDECHQLAESNNKVTAFVNKLDTQIRYGFSGTLPTEKIKKFKLISLIGPILYSIKAKELQDEGFISNIKIFANRFRHINKPHFVVNETNYKTIHVEEYEFIESKARVNDYFCKFVCGLQGNTTIFFDHTAHGHRLFDAINLDHSGIVRFINGEIPLHEREETVKLMESRNDVILVANCKAAGVGLNIKNLTNIVFAMSGKGETKIIQGIGRGLRLHKDKICLNLYDFHHNMKYSERHFKERKILYNVHYGIKDIEVNDVEI